MKDQNIYDNDDFFDQYMALRESEDNLNDLLEQPAMKKLLPDLAEKSVIDLGCGYGHNCLDFVKRGAKRVVGIDISSNMIELAKKESVSEEIEYINGSMTELNKLTETFDFAYSSLAFHYIEDFDALARDIYSILNKGGYLLFSQEHPIVTATIDGKGHFNYDENGNRTSYTMSNYGQEGKREITWYVNGVIKYHRPFGRLITALANAGFVIDTVLEPMPEPWAIEKLPKLVKEFIKPCFIIIKAKKPD